MRVTVPASSANLGPGFDVLGLALGLPFVLSTTPDEGLLPVEATHPASVAFGRGGGDGDLWWRSPIPPGRGLGFSGAARVAGALLGTAVAGAVDRDAAMSIAAELEGHPDNAAASLYGGVTVAAGGHVVQVPLALDLEVVVWWPQSTTSTDRSRTELPEAVGFADAVFNVGRAALLVGALAAGDQGALAAAAEDRLHQDRRLAASPASGAAMASMREAGALAVWLSGSGPTVAAFVEPATGARVLGSLPDGGTARLLEIDRVGAVVERTT